MNFASDFNNISIHLMCSELRRMRDCLFLSQRIILPFNLYQGVQKADRWPKSGGASSGAAQYKTVLSLDTGYGSVLLGCHIEWRRYDSDCVINIKVDRKQEKKSPQRAWSTLFIFSNRMIHWLRWALRSLLWKLSSRKFQWRGWYSMR